MRWAGGKVWVGVEYVGDSIADFIGLNDSRYQWAIDEHFKQKDLREEARRLEAEADRELQSSSAA